ncbi:hypothetical protein ACQVTT_28910, partial [Bacillus mycoides]
HLNKSILNIYQHIKENLSQDSLFLTQKPLILLIINKERRYTQWYKLNKFKMLIKKFNMKKRSKKKLKSIALHIVNVVKEIQLVMDNLNTSQTQETVFSTVFVANF